MLRDGAPPKIQQKPEPACIWLQEDCADFKVGGTSHEPLHSEADGDLIFIPNYRLTHAVMEQLNIYELEPNGMRCSCKLSG